MRAHLDDADLAAAARYERRFRHDVMAHVHAFGDQAPAARPYLHLGATSAFVTDNADLIVMREGLRLLLGRLIAVLGALETLRPADGGASLPRLHPLSAGAAHDGRQARHALDAGLRARRRGARAPDRRRSASAAARAPPGHRPRSSSCFGGDHDKVRELERRVTAKLGFAEAFAVTGQTYPRKTDSRVLDALSGIAQSAGKMSGDLRLLQHEGELLEPFESEQIGSSAMAYKRNPMRAERIAGLARFVISLQANGAHTAATQWLERTLDDSANRRLTLPEAFLATDAILVLATNIAAGLEVREDVIRRHVAGQMPFMATERWLMLGVGRGGDRQTLHEVIRRHSLAVAEEVSRGGPNDLLERLASDPAFAAVPAAALRAELEPANYTGRASRQVGEFLAEYLDPLLRRVRPLAAEAEAAEVGV